MEAGGVQSFRAAFAKIKASFDQENDAQNDARNIRDLICKQGFYNRCSVLKLQKASWTNDRMDRVQNKTGIFFSVWIDESAASKSHANYNIHALKLRRLKGYSIASRDFANDFRDAFASMRDAWPNVSVDFGPLTLMQGYIQIAPKSFERDILRLLDRFKPVSHLIDRLLDSRRN
jgi:hypothetical protein